jgi:hypothetical protein
MRRLPALFGLLLVSCCLVGCSRDTTDEVVSVDAHAGNGGAALSGNVSGAATTGNSGSSSSGSGSSGSAASGTGPSSAGSVTGGAGGSTGSVIVNP